MRDIGWLRSCLKQPGYAETYTPGGVQPELGDLFKNPALAESLQQMAAHGRDAFYNGKLTEVMVEFLRAQGGTHTVKDFAEFQPEWVEPISTTYRGWTVSELPPNGQGIAALSMLNIMEHFPMASYGQNSAAALHVMIEAKKLAYADMFRYVGDPRFGRGAGEADVVQRTGGRARQADRYGPRGLPSGSVANQRAAEFTRQRYDLHVDNRQRRKHRFADPE